MYRPLSECEAGACGSWIYRKGEGRNGRIHTRTMGIREGTDRYYFSNDPTMKFVSTQSGHGRMKPMRNRSCQARVLLFLMLLSVYGSVYAQDGASSGQQGGSYYSPGGPSSSPGASL